MSEWTTLRARVASLSRSRTPDDPDLLAARRELTAVRLADYITRSLAASPSLTTDQRDTLAALLRNGEEAAA